MWVYERKLEFPINIKCCDPATANIICSQLGGPDGEMGAATRYLSQRFSMPYEDIAGLLTDIGTEELAHIEMISTIMYQLTRNVSADRIKGTSYEAYYLDHTTGVYPASSAGVPFSAATIQSTGDPIADLTEDLAAEQKARITYDNILRLLDDPDVIAPIKFLREREIVHYQRFAEALGKVYERLGNENPYACNPAFDGNNCKR